ncbi:uncharacterized protein MYCFIDRAFT_175198 [Pseudocercospora fijiensis CIRAD86]|uniref:Zn(2)-C6 fungal-type domain-containing protein n=1 Tax=Pseudocercospora fijiensis (strain CIRAD86) TaxID=383855 RepID=M3AAI1_PSEFD|nr:uncharacterized protein MYCFIDRAFT_175198 [Pseudocercospora fijiensis CIRAD86]EME81606.1 hypothetical protein MYCFIDRAFT_175198 [Pseudocercospora fijiensis CIRAD86]
MLTFHTTLAKAEGSSEFHWSDLLCDLCYFARLNSKPTTTNTSIGLMTAEVGLSETRRVTCNESGWHYFHTSSTAIPVLPVDYSRPPSGGFGEDRKVWQRTQTRRPTKRGRTQLVSDDAKTIEIYTVLPVICINVTRLVLFRQSADMFMSQHLTSLCEILTSFPLTPASPLMATSLPMFHKSNSATISNVRMKIVSTTRQQNEPPLDVEQTCTKELPTCGRCQIDGRNCTYSEARTAGRPRKIRTDPLLGSTAGTLKQGDTGSLLSPTADSEGRLTDSSSQYTNDTACYKDHTSCSVSSSAGSLQDPLEILFPGALPISTGGTLHAVRTDSDISESSTGRGMHAIPEDGLLAPAQDASNSIASFPGIEFNGNPFSTSFPVPNHTDFLGSDAHYQDIEDLLQFVNHTAPYDTGQLDRSAESLAAIDRAFDICERLVMSEGMYAREARFLLLLAVLSQVESILSLNVPGLQLGHRDTLRAIMLLSTLEHPEKFGYQDSADGAPASGAAWSQAGEIDKRLLVATDDESLLVKELQMDRMHGRDMCGRKPGRSTCHAEGVLNSINPFENWTNKSVHTASPTQQGYPDRTTL